MSVYAVSCAVVMFLVGCGLIVMVFVGVRAMSEPREPTSLERIIAIDERTQRIEQLLTNGKP